MNLFRYKNYIIPSILFYLIPLGLVTGPFLPDLFLSTIAILFLVDIIKNKNFFFIHTNFFKIFLFFYFILILSSIFSQHSSFSLETSILYIRYFFYTLAISFLFIEKPKLLSKFINFLFFIVMIVVFDGYIEFIFGKNILGISSPDPSRILSFFHAMIIGSFLSKIMPLLFIYLIIKENKKKYLYLIYSFICLTYLIIFLSGERSAFFHATIIFILISIALKETRSIFIFAAIFISVIIGSITASNEVIKKRMYSSVIDGLSLEKLSNQNNNQELIIFSSVHDKLIRVAYNIFKDNKLLGSGPNTFRISCKEYSNSIYQNNGGCQTHPHNTYAQLLSEIGILGIFIILLLYFFLIIEFFKYLFKSKNKNQSIHFCLIIYFLIVLFPFTPTGNFFNNWICVIYFLPLGIFLSNLKKI